MQTRTSELQSNLNIQERLRQFCELTNLATSAHGNYTQSSRNATSLDLFKQALNQAIRSYNVLLTDKPLLSITENTTFMSASNELQALREHYCKIKNPAPSVSGLFSSTDMKDIENWTGKKFGKLRAYKIADQNIRILLHTGGFALFFPREVWRQFDMQLNRYMTLPDNEEATCWIAGKGFAFTKVDINKNDLENDVIDYASDNNDVAMNKVQAFLNKNFIHNTQARPESSYFTIGSYMDSPNTPRPFRMRLGGDFRISF